MHEDGPPSMEETRYLKHVQLEDHYEKVYSYKEILSLDVCYTIIIKMIGLEIQSSIIKGDRHPKRKKFFFLLYFFYPEQHPLLFLTSVLISVHTLYRQCYNVKNRLNCCQLQFHVLLLELKLIFVGLGLIIL